jgi:hypothetical protein
MNVVPDDVLLEIFDFHMKVADIYRSANAWHLLIHVCRRWRNIVLSSSRRLNLRLLCTERTPVTEMLDIWPAFLPIVIYSGGEPSEDDAENVVSALKHPDRVCEIVFEEISSSSLQLFSEAMHGPFPVLTILDLRLGNRQPFFLDPFFELSAPRLRSLELDGIPFFGVHKLLLSASGLVRLSLWDLPEYVLPEEIAPCLSSMAGLESIYLGFRYAEYLRHKKGQHPYPLPRTVLPALTYLGLKAPSGYSEDLMARLDTPRLDKVTAHCLDTQFDEADIDYLIQLEQEYE